MISGKMYWHKEPKKPIQEIIEWLIEAYNIQNINYVLVHPSSLIEETIWKNIKIKPENGVLMNHFWFISENNLENQPEFRNFEKIT